MKAKLTKLFLIITPIVLGLFSLTPAFASQGIDCNDNNIPQTVRESAGCDGNDNKLPDIIQGILNAIILVSGIVAVIFVVIGGYNYMTSAGDSAKVKKGKDTILYALIGLAVCALAFVIVNWVVGIINNQNSNDSLETNDDDDTGLIIEQKDIAFLEKKL